MISAKREAIYSGVLGPRAPNGVQGQGLEQGRAPNGVKVQSPRTPFRARSQVEAYFANSNAIFYEFGNVIMPHAAAVLGLSFGSARRELNYYCRRYT